MNNSISHIRAKIRLSSRENIIDFIYALCDGYLPIYFLLKILTA